MDVVDHAGPGEHTLRARRDPGSNPALPCRGCAVWAFFSGKPPSPPIVAFGMAT